MGAPPTRLALVSDIHMREGHADRILTGLETAVEHLAARDPAHAFVLGDLIASESVAADRANVEAVAEVLDDAPFPVTYLLGNHDVGRLDREVLRTILGQERFRGVETVGGRPVVYLDSKDENLPRSRGGLGTDQRRWLAETLQQYDRPLLLLHHPVGDFDISENVWFADYPERAFLGDRKETLDLLDTYGPVRGTVSGHLHQTGVTRFGGVPHVSVNAFSNERPNKPFTGTFATVEIEEEVHVEVRTVDAAEASYTFENDRDASE